MEHTESVKKGKKEQGFTIIEVLVAMVILMFGLLAVGSMQVAAMRGNFMSGNTSMALSLASDRMEDLLNKDYAHPDLNLGAHAPERISIGGAVVGTGGFYLRSYNITTQTSPTRKIIDITVTWENNRHHVSIVSVRNALAAY
jgi:prepilin-type N-terminal cleavage/methylation domain-containing protein